jgi:predicted metal-dependent hydrolase
VSSAAQLELRLTPTRKGGEKNGIRAVKLGRRIVTYRFERARRRTIGLFVDRHGLAARAPRWVPVDQVEAFMREKEAWILAKLAELPLRETRSVQWSDGGRFLLFGADLRITEDVASAAPAVYGDELRVPGGEVDAQMVRKAVLDWLGPIALARFRERAALLAPRAELPVPRLSLSSARTQWGSCTMSRAGVARIRLHWRLAHLPIHVVDYVIAHELAHQREMNHSPRFWSWVAQMVPDYKVRQDDLRRLAAALPDV